MSNCGFVFFVLFCFFANLSKFGRQFLYTQNYLPTSKTACTWFSSAYFSSAQKNSIQKFELDFCDNICRTHTVWVKSKTYEAQKFLKRKFSVSLKKDFIFQFHIYFSAIFAFYFLVSYTYSQFSVMISFNIETLNSGKNLPL